MLNPHAPHRYLKPVATALLIGTASIWTPSLVGVDQGSPEPAPAEVTAFWEGLIGTWVADNSRHRSDADTMDAYGIEWTWGLNRKSIVGRLYGIKAGKDTGTFWEFREFWHPGERTAIAMQFARDGTYGVGPHQVNTDGTSEMLQVFYDPVQRTITKTGHRGKLTRDVHTTTSFAVDGKGVWKERRSYVWRRQRN